MHHQIDALMEASNSHPSASSPPVGCRQSLNHQSTLYFFSHFFILFLFIFFFSSHVIHPLLPLLIWKILPCSSPLPLLFFFSSIFFAHLKFFSSVFFFRSLLPPYCNLWFLQSKCGISILTYELYMLYFSNLILTSCFSYNISLLYLTWPVKMWWNHAMVWINLESPHAVIMYLVTYMHH